MSWERNPKVQTSGKNGLGIGISAGVAGLDTSYPRYKKKGWLWLENPSS